MREKLFSAIFIAILFASAGQAAVARVILPTPQKILFEGAALDVNRNDVTVSSNINSHDPRVLKALKNIFPSLTVSTKDFETRPGGVFIYTADAPDSITTANCSQMFCTSLAIDSFSPQEYFLGIRKLKDNSILVLILFKRSKMGNGVGDSYGEFYAVKTLKKLFDGTSLPEISILDWPEFSIRGVLEGFYGKPWPSEKRKNFIPWIADQKFNIYLYTPKDDNKLRLGWRSKFEERELAQINSLNKLAEDNYVRYCWSLSPGININFSNNKDLSSAYAKFKSVVGQGVKCFTIAFDDVGLALTPYDRNNFKTYWEGQVSFTNKVVGRLLDENPDITFALVPNDYWGDLAQESEYLRYLGANLDPRVSIGWTGNKIAPTTVVAEDAVIFNYFIRRKPFLGDNFPVLDNITTNGGRLALGPLRGRDPRLFRYINGFAANAMPVPEASKPAFLTISDFTWNPFNYDADRSWESAMKTIAGEDKYEPLLFFAKQSESSLIWKYDAMNLNENTRAVILAYQKSPGYDMKTASAPLAKMLDRFKGMDKELAFIRNDDNAPMLDEMKVWIDKLVMYGDTGAKALDMLNRKSSGETIPKEEIDALDKEWQKGEENKAVITKMVMFNFINNSLALLRDQPLPEKKKLNSLIPGED